MFQKNLTVASGKMLIAKSIAVHPSIKERLKSGTVVIIAGTTNGYVAQEILKSINQEKEFSMKKFFRGITLPPYMPTNEFGRLHDDTEFFGDVVIKDGIWQKGKTILDVADSLIQGDIIIKGANAVDIINKRAAILIGHPKGGTIIPSISASVGKRIKLIFPVGLEKRVSNNIDEITELLNDTSSTGCRLLPVSGEIITELEAISILTGATAKLVSAGGVCGAEGSVWLAIYGTRNQETNAKKILLDIINEPPFSTKE
jgi:hypothetical protein